MSRGREEHRAAREARKAQRRAAKADRKRATAAANLSLLAAGEPSSPEAVLLVFCGQDRRQT